MESFFDEEMSLQEMQKSFPEDFTILQKLLCHYLFTGLVKIYDDCHSFSMFSGIGLAEFTQCRVFVSCKLCSQDDLQQYVVGKWDALHKRHVRVNQQRSTKLRARLKEHPSKDYWEDVFQCLEKRPWLIKEAWFTFDFFVRPGSSDKILDGWMDWKIQDSKVFKDASYVDRLKEKLDVH